MSATEAPPSNWVGRPIKRALKAAMARFREAEPPAAVRRARSAPSGSPPELAHGLAAWLAPDSWPELGRSVGHGRRSLVLGMPRAPACRSGCGAGQLAVPGDAGGGRMEVLLDRRQRGRDHRLGDGVRQSGRSQNGQGYSVVLAWRLVHGNWRLRVA